MVRIGVAESVLLLGPDVVVVAVVVLFKVLFWLQFRVWCWVTGCCAPCCFGRSFGCCFGGYSGCCVGQTITYKASMRCSSNVVSMSFKNVVLLMEVSSVAE